MKKIIIFIAIIVIGMLAIMGFVFWSFSSQYNSNGVSHFLVITIDKSIEKTYIGDLEGKKVYLENLNISDTNFRTIDAENLSVKKAIEKKLVSINEWKKYAWSTKKDGDKLILKFENYKIVISNDECIISPLIR